MKLGTLTAILGEHHLAYRDNLCPVPHDEHGVSSRAESRDLARRGSAPLVPSAHPDPSTDARDDT